MSFARLVAAGFGAGFLPKAPGTFGSLVGLAVGLLLLHLSRIALAAAIILAIIGGIQAVRTATGMPMFGAAKNAHDDPGWIVIDEIAGQMLALLALPHPGWRGAAFAFVLFRLFDICKPGPIGWADRQGGAAGLMADDILAGFVTCLVLLVVEA